MTFECMRLAQTRLATIDSYAVFFAVAMYYFMYDYFAVKSYDLRFTRSLKPLLFCGIMFGLGASSKWVCMYTGGGLAIMFFLAKIMEGADYTTGRKTREEGELPWFVKNFLPTCGMCLLFFVLIPIGIYMLSYIPYMASNPDKSLVEIVLANQDYMFNYHSGLDATHPYGSQWWSWPVIGRPIWYYIGPDMGDGMRSTIVSLGNPLIWWVGIPAAIGSGYFAWRNKDKSMIIFYVALILQYAPWILIDRVCFIYHFFTSVPFLIFMIVYFIKNLVEKEIIPKYVVWIYMAFVMIVFFAYYPVLTGMPVPTSYVEKLRLFSSWYF
jgi:dolichyl-phosphate-mannose--protein O-mannosyl transferase